MQLGSKLSLRAAVRLGGLSAGAILATFTFAGAALADGPSTVTVQAPTTARASTAPAVNAAATLGSSPTAVSASAPANANLTVSPAGHVAVNGGVTTSAGGVTASAGTAPAAAQVNLGGTAASASVSGNTGNPAASARVGNISVRTAPAGTGAQVRAGNPQGAAPGAVSGSAVVSAPTTGSANSASSAAAQLNAGGTPATAAATAPTTASAATAPSANVAVSAAGNSVSNSTTAPGAAGAASCPYVGVNVAGAACRSSGSATAVGYAPTRGAASAAPVAHTQAHIAGNTVNNTTTAPAGARAATCPLIGVNASGYGCRAPGNAAAVVFAPTRAHGTTAPATHTQAHVVGNNVANTTTAPTAAGIGLCPLVGVGAVGYGCRNPGSATAVAFTPAGLHAATSPSSGTQANVAGNSAQNATAAPANLSGNTCPLVGIGITGYGCGNAGSATGVLFAPTQAQGGATPSSGSGANVAGNTLSNTTTAPAAAGLNTCPLVGIGISGYGCGNPGSATGVLFAPTSGSGSISPAGSTAANLAGAGLGNTTTAPTMATFNTCPLIGLGITGYGCGNPGSATGVVTVPTSGGGTTTPSTGTQVNLPGGPGGNVTVSVPTGGTINTCPVIGIGVSGYGCNPAVPPVGITNPPGNGQTPPAAPPANVPNTPASNPPAPNTPAGNTPNNDTTPRGGTPNGTPRGTPRGTPNRYPAAPLAPQARVPGIRTTQAPAAPAGGNVTAAPPAGTPSHNPGAPTTPAGHPSVPPVGITNHPPARVPSVPTTHVPRTNVPSSPTPYGGQVAGSFGQLPSGAAPAAVPAAAHVNAGGMAPMTGSALGISTMPRTGGADGNGPGRPLFPILIALMLIGLGALTRGFALLAR